MKPLRVAALALLLVGCAGRPPLPPDCEGQLVPINSSVSTLRGVSDAARPRS